MKQIRYSKGETLSEYLTREGVKDMCKHIFSQYAHAYLQDGIYHLNFTNRTYSREDRRQSKRSFIYPLKFFFLESGDPFCVIPFFSPFSGILLICVFFYHLGSYRTGLIKIKTRKESFPCLLPLPPRSSWPPNPSGSAAKKPP